MNGAQLFVKCLENEGVKYIFGVPGEENEDFLFALDDSPIQFVPTRHEQGAAFIANVMGRLSGKAGVCLSTLGPGATNLITGVADAYLDRSPLIAITGQGSTERMHHESHQMIDIKQIFKAISKYSVSVIHTAIIPEVVRKAFKSAEAEKPQAVHIELPENIAGKTLENEVKVLNRNQVRRPSPDQQSIDQALSLLNESQNILILAGNGAIRKRASHSLTNLAHQCNIMVATSFMGKGAISAKDSFALGTIGLGFKDYIAEAFENADTVITIGYDISEYDPKHWNIGTSKKIIHIDFEQADVFEDYQPDVEIVGDITNSIISITQHLKKQYPIDWVKPIKNRIQKSIQKYSPDPDETTFNTPAILHATREVMTEDGLLISDVGTHKMWIARNYETYCPNGCIISNGLASMGIALPGGIAAKIDNPNRQVITVMGDGGALMNFQEIETAKRLGLAFVILILNDNNYGLIKWKQNMHRGASVGTNIDNPDFVMLAKSFGVDAHKPKDYKDFSKILGHALHHNKLTVIEVPIATDVNNELIEELTNYYNGK